MASASLLGHMRRLSKTEKESHAGLLTKQSLAAPCPITFVDIGLKQAHPILRVIDFLKMLGETGKLELLSGGFNLFDACRTFWVRYKEEDCEHPVYQGERDLSIHVPMCVYGDEGQSHKKSAIMILAIQPVIGRGTSYSQEREDKDLGCNMCGHSCVTRILYSVMQSKLYSRNPAIFDKLVQTFADELQDAFSSGVEVKFENRTIRLHPTILYCKGDWPMLKKLGRLVRSHHQSISAPSTSKGICHLCLGGTPAFPDWSDCVNGSWMHPASLQTADPPWSSESPLTSTLAQSPSIPKKAWFYRPDLFHLLHKGVMAELAGSAIVSEQDFW